MRHISTLWKANTIAFISSFCVMVIELIAARLMAPYIGVSLYTWTSIIGVILAGISLGNYLGGKVADRYPFPSVLAGMFFTGALLTVAILPAIKLVTDQHWFGNLPIMVDFVLKTSCIFFLPAFVLSMVSPVVIKLTLANLGETGGIVGTIYACSTAGAILGTFMTGFYFILWFGTRSIVWMVAAALLLTGILAWFSWRVPGRWRLSLKNFIHWTVAVLLFLTYALLFQVRGNWQENYTRESNYYTIRVWTAEDNTKSLILDHLVHSYVVPGDPTALKYDYLKIFREIISYVARDTPALNVLHLGGGGYSLPRYLEIVYPGSVNEVVEIDPAVTQVAYQELELPRDTSIKTYNRDARLFLIQRERAVKYQVVVGDVFNDLSTPYHLTTLEFDKLVKANMAADGIYLVNIIDDSVRGKYLPAFIHTLRQAFNHVYLFTTVESWENRGVSTFVIAASDRSIDLADYRGFVTEGGRKQAVGSVCPESQLDEFLAVREPILLTDDYAPTDILVAPLHAKRYPQRARS